MPPRSWYVVWAAGFTVAGLVAGIVGAYAYCH